MPSIFGDKYLAFLVFPISRKVRKYERPKAKGVSSSVGSAS